MAEDIRDLLTIKRLLVEVALDDKLKRRIDRMCDETLEALVPIAEGKPK